MLFLCGLYKQITSGSRNAATSKMECFVIIVNGAYYKALHLGCCSGPRSASEQSVSVESGKF